MKPLITKRKTEIGLAKTYFGTAYGRDNNELVVIQKSYFLNTLTNNEGCILVKQFKDKNLWCKESATSMETYLKQMNWLLNNNIINIGKL